jgi:hypothetical protein
MVQGNSYYICKYFLVCVIFPYFLELWKSTLGSQYIYIYMHIYISYEYIYIYVHIEAHIYTYIIYIYIDV